MQQNKNNKLLIPENLESEQFIHCSWVLETTLELQRSRFIWDTFENLTSYFGNLEPKRKRYEKLMRKSLGNIFDFFIEKNDYDAMNPKSCCFEDFKIIVKGFGIVGITLDPDHNFYNGKNHEHLPMINAILIVSLGY